MANWNTGAAFANSFLNTIQGLTALQNAQMQNARLQRQMQQELGYETAVAEESQKAKGIDLNAALQNIKYEDTAQEGGPTITAAEKQANLQAAIPTIQQLAPEQQAEWLRAQGAGLENLKPYQTAGGETKFNQLGKEAMASDVNRAVRQRMLETGNIYGQERSLQMGKLTREDEAAQAEMDFSNWMVDQTKQIQADPTKWVQDNLAGYNKAGKGSFLDDGMTGKVVMSADGKTASFVQMDKKGKTISSTPITAETAMQGLQAMAFDKYRAMPGKFKESFTMGLEQEKLGETKRHNRAVEGIYGARLGGGTSGAKQNEADAQNLYGQGVVNPLTKRPFASIDEARAYVTQSRLGMVGTKGRELTETQKIAYGKALDYMSNNFTGKETDEDVKKVAKRFNLPADLFGVGGLGDYEVALGGKDVDKSRPKAQAPQQALPMATAGGGAGVTGFTPTRTAGVSPMRTDAAQARITEIDQILQGLNVPEDKRFLLELERNQLIGGNQPRTAAIRTLPR